MKSASRWMLLTGFVLTIFGSKLLLLSVAGSDLPVLDQWDGEAARVVAPWLEGRLTLADLFAPHNEHRLVLLRLYVLGLLEVSGQWSAFTQTVPNALWHCASAVVLLIGARRWIRGAWFVAYGALLLLLFTIPFSWENTIVGFQAQFYFLLLFSLGHVFLTLGSDRFSARWVLGQLCAVLSLGSMASGFLSAAAILAVLLYRFILERRWTAQQCVTAGWATLCIAVGWWMKCEVAGHEPLKAHSVGTFLYGLLQLVSWPGPAVLPFILVPALLYAIRASTRRDSPKSDPILLGLLAWCLLQFAAIAYGRGSGLVLASRYLDLLSVNVALGLIFLLRVAPERRRNLLAGSWLAGVVIALAFQGADQWRRNLAPLIAFHHQQERLVAEYVRTGDSKLLQPKTWPEIPYPNGTLLMGWLDTPSIRSVLPPSVRAPVRLARHDEARSQTLPTSLPPARLPIAVCTASPGAAAAPQHWRSVEFPETTMPILRFRIAGDLGPLSSALRLTVKGHTGEVPVVPDHAPGDRWKNVSVSRPPGRGWVEAVDRDPDGWFAVASPVELTRVTWFVEKTIKHHAVVLLTGCALLVFGGMFHARSRVRRSL